MTSPTLEISAFPGPERRRAERLETRTQKRGTQRLRNCYLVGVRALCEQPARLEPADGARIATTTPAHGDYKTDWMVAIRRRKVRPRRPSGGNRRSLGHMSFTANRKPRGLVCSPSEVEPAQTALPGATTSGGEQSQTRARHDVAVVHATSSSEISDSSVRRLAGSRWSRTRFTVRLTVSQPIPTRR